MDLKWHLEAVWVFGKCWAQCQDGIQLLLAVIVPPGSPSSVPGSCPALVAHGGTVSPFISARAKAQFTGGNWIWDLSVPCLASMGASMAAPKAPRLAAALGVASLG